MKFSYEEDKLPDIKIVEFWMEKYIKFEMCKLNRKKIYKFIIYSMYNSYFVGI